MISPILQHFHHIAFLQADKRTEEKICFPKKREILPNVFPFLSFSCGLVAGVNGILHENSDLISFGVCSMFWGILLLLHSIEERLII